MSGCFLASETTSATVLGPNDLVATSATGKTWGIERIRAPYAWHGLGIDGAGVTVAIMDSGVDFAHPDLIANYRGNLGGGSFSHVGNWFNTSVPTTTVPTDTLGHGTHVAGTAVGQNGIGVAPGANIGPNGAVFEATHGSAPKYKGLNKVNPVALILSGMLMLKHLGEVDAAKRLEKAVADVIAEGKSVTYDLKDDRNDPTAVGTREMAEAICKKL